MGSNREEGQMKSAPRNRAFTLIELIIVVAIIAVLTALIIPAVQKARDAANKAQCQNNLRQIGLALHQYHDSKRSLPPGCSTKASDYRFLSWQARLLPWLEQEGLWRKTEKAFTADWRFWSQAHFETRTTVVPTFVCPAHGQTVANPQPENSIAATTHYLGVSGAQDGTGVLFTNSRIRFADVTDGTSQTIAAGERPPAADQYFGWWYAGVGQLMDGSLDTHLAAVQYNQTFRVIV
jgi:prepilin-type N-terminal cleavage/methylation domain-containing protein